MKTAFEWVLPAGWTAGEVGFPAPERFVEEGLVSFGHSGTVVFPVTVTAPVDFKEPVELGLKVSWLVCGEGSCVPGKAELKIRLVPGAPEPTPEAARIAEARGRVPRVWDQAARLEVSEAGGRVRIRMEDLGEAAVPWDRFEGFSATPEALAPGVVLRLARQDGAWAAEVPVHEYAAGPLRELCLVFADPERRVPPLQLTWRAKPAP